MPATVVGGGCCVPTKRPTTSHPLKLERVSGFEFCNVMNKPSCLNCANQALLFEAREGRVAVSATQAAIAGWTDG